MNRTPTNALQTLPRANRETHQGFLTIEHRANSKHCLRTVLVNIGHNSISSAKSLGMLPPALPPFAKPCVFPGDFVLCSSPCRGTFGVRITWVCSDSLGFGWSETLYRPAKRSLAQCARQCKLWRAVRESSLGLLLQLSLNRAFEIAEL